GRNGVVRRIVALVCGCAVLLLAGCAAAPPSATPGTAARAPVVPFAGQWRVFAGELGDPQWSGHLSDVVGVALNASGVPYATDSRNGLVQVIGPDGRLLARWGGSASSIGPLASPAGVALDLDGNVYVVDAAG